LTLRKPQSSGYNGEQITYYVNVGSYKEQLFRESPTIVSLHWASMAALLQEQDLSGESRERLHVAGHHVHVNIARSLYNSSSAFRIRSSLLQELQDSASPWTSQT
jgi:hypothetical protein